MSASYVAAWGYAPMHWIWSRWSVVCRQGRYIICTEHAPTIDGMPPLLYEAVVDDFGNLVVVS